MCTRPLTDSTGTVLTTDGVGRCSACRTLKPRGEFYRDRSRSSGLSSRCRSCDLKRLKSVPERSLVADLKKLLKRHPSYRPMLEAFANSIAA